MYFDVCSRINPEYLITGHPCDYFGIYNVVERNDTGDIVGEPVATYTGAQRRDAYEHAGRLQKAQCATLILRQ